MLSSVAGKGSLDNREKVVVLIAAFSFNDAPLPLPLRGGIHEVFGLRIAYDESCPKFQSNKKVEKQMLSH